MAALQLLWRTAILSPSPRAWPFNVGRSRYADRLRPNFLFDASNIANGHATYKFKVFTRCGLSRRRAADPVKLRRQCSTAASYYSVAWRSLGLRSRWRALRPKNSA